MLQLSKRLQAVANLVGEAGVVADVGTDHGYIPVYLVSFGKAERAIALDVNEGPLLRAKEHICQFHLEEQIKTRRSDGLSELQPGEAEVLVIAGMGGALMMRILDEGEEIARTARRLVLQPQSELFSFRRYLTEHGYCITAEDMVYEDGKFYSMMAAVWRGDDARDSCVKTCARGIWSASVSLKYGALLIADRHPVLRQYLEYQQGQKQKILKSLENNARQDVTERKVQVLLELEEIERLLEVWETSERSRYYDVP